MTTIESIRNMSTEALEEIEGHDDPFYSYSTLNNIFLYRVNPYIFAFLKHFKDSDECNPRNAIYAKYIPIGNKYSIATQDDKLAGIYFSATFWNNRIQSLISCGLGLNKGLYKNAHNLYFAPDKCHDGNYHSGIYLNYIAPAKMLQDCKNPILVKECKFKTPHAAVYKCGQAKSLKDRFSNHATNFKNHDKDIRVSSVRYQSIPAYLMDAAENDLFFYLGRCDTTCPRKCDHSSKNVFSKKFCVETCKKLCSDRHDYHFHIDSWNLVKKYEELIMLNGSDDIDVVISKMNELGKTYFEQDRAREILAEDRYKKLLFSTNRREKRMIRERTQMKQDFERREEKIKQEKAEMKQDFERREEKREEKIKQEKAEMKKDFEERRKELEDRHSKLSPDQINQVSSMFKQLKIDDKSKQ